MPTRVSINGAIFDEDAARVSVFDRGFLYGDGVFEVMRTYHGVPFAEAAHMERLARSALQVLIAMPLNESELAAEVRAVMRAACNEESYIRVMVTRGRGPMMLDPSVALSPTRVIIVAQLAPQPEGLYEDGVSVALVRASRPTDDTRAAGAKASNYLANLLALHEARERGAYEALIVGCDGSVIEGASSNVFLVKDGLLLTPPVSAGLLPGITRATVLEAARALGIGAREATMRQEDLYGADEVFITSTLREVVPVVTVDWRKVGSGHPGPTTKRLHDGFRRLVDREKTLG